MTHHQAVKSFYKNKNIFLTGATGFVGVAYIEKLLRSIPDVGDIYVLLRPQKKYSIQERLEIMKNNSVMSYSCIQYSYIYAKYINLYYYLIRSLMY